MIERTCSGAPQLFFQSRSAFARIAFVRRRELHKRQSELCQPEDRFRKQSRPLRTPWSRGDWRASKPARAASAYSAANLVADKSSRLCSSLAPKLEARAP